MSAVTSTRDPLRTQLLEMWSCVAGGWTAHAGYIDARGRPISERMLALTTPRPGERVLELACGTGGPGIDAAPLVEPGGDVVVSDFSPQMTAIAASRVRTTC